MQTDAALDAVVTTQIVTASTPTAFKVAAAVANIEKLRDEASGYTIQYEIGGRNALNKLMAAVYKHYYGAVSSGKVEQLAAQLRSKLKAIDPELEPTKNAHMSNMLVRYVFKDPDAKQVSVYARCLRVLAQRSPAILPKDFVAAVNAQKGGYSGFNEPKKAGKPKMTVSIALSELENAPVIGTLDLKFAEDEECKLFIALPGDDGEGELKELPVTKEQRDAVLVAYAKKKAAADKTPKSKPSAALQLAVINADEKRIAARKLIVNAEASGDAIALARAKASLDVATEEWKAAKKLAGAK